MKERMTLEEYKAFRAKPVRQSNVKRGDKAKANIGWNLVILSRRLGLTLVTEYRFNPERRWRADWALFGKTPDGKDVRLIVEYEGLAFGETHHTSSEGYSKDAEKYNSAQALGWKVLRFTYLTCETLNEELKKHINQ